MSFFTESEDSERRSSRWDRRAGPANYLALVGGHTASTALALAALWLASRIVGTSGYGGIVAVFAASQLIGQLTIHWTALAVFRLGCEEFVATGRIAASFWNRLFILGSSLALVLLLSPLWLAPLCRWLEIPAHARWVVLAHLMATGLAAHVQQSLYAAKLPRFQAMVQACEKSLLVAAMVVLIATGDDRWSLVAAAFALAPALAATAGLIRLRPFILPASPVDPALTGRMMRFSLPLVLFNVVGYLTTNHIDAFFILRMLSSSALGIYGLAYQMAGSFMQLPALAGSLLTASFITSSYRGEGAQVRRFFDTTLPSLTLVWSLGCALAAVGGGILVSVAFDASFRPAVELLWPLLTAAVFAGPVSIAFGPLANSRSRTIIPAVAAGAGAATNLVLNLALIPRFGLLGCAWATAAAFGVSFLVCAFLVSRIEPIPVLPTVIATAPTLVGASCSQPFGTWSALLAAAITAAFLGVMKRDTLRDALAGRSRLSFGREPAPETVIERSS